VRQIRVARRRAARRDAHDVDVEAPPPDRSRRGDAAADTLHRIDEVLASA
jgi:hypothetical protein